MKWYEQIEKEMELEEQKFYDSLNWLEKLVDDPWIFIIILIGVSLFCWWFGFLIGRLIV